MTSFLLYFDRAFSRNNDVIRRTEHSHKVAKAQLLNKSTPNSVRIKMNCNHFTSLFCLIVNKLG